MSVLVVTCYGCGREFEPTKRDILRGVWRFCPDCRPPPNPPKPNHEHDTNPEGSNR